MDIPVGGGHRGVPTVKTWMVYDGTLEVPGLVPDAADIERTWETRSTHPFEGKEPFK